MEVQGNKKVAKCRVCGVELTDKNWCPSCIKKHMYICKECKKRQNKQYNKIHEREYKQYMKQYNEVRKEKSKQYMKQYYKAHREKAIQYRKIYAETHKEERRQRDKLKKYGITIQDELDMLKAQDGRCAICGKLLTNLTEACIDHDHKTGKVRGILCGHCNRGLGYFKDNSEALIKAAVYLRNQGDK